jgi:hypothetical protein
MKDHMIYHRILTIVVLCLLTAPSLKGQQDGAAPSIQALDSLSAQVAQPTLRADSVRAAGWAAGYLAAHRQPPAVGSALLSFVGGVPVGLLGLPALLTEDLVLIGIAGAGAGLWVLVHDRASEPPRTLPLRVEQKFSGQPPLYREAFMEAYGREVVRRRTRASHWGGGTGGAVGVGLLGWLIWEALEGGYCF